MSLKIVTGLLCFALLYVAVDSAAARRMRREAYALPDGVEFYVGEIRTTFACPGNGYYADTDNNCQLFHVCLTNNMPDGTSKQEQYTFACGNQTVFNQLSMTCDHAEDALPCEQSSVFHYLNDRLGADPAVPLHEEQDLTNAAQYGSRTLTARAEVAAAVAAEGRSAPATVTTTATATATRRRRPGARRQRQAAAEAEAAAAAAAASS